MLLVLFVNFWQLQANQSLLNKHDNTWSLGSHGGISYNFCGNIHIITAQGVYASMRFLEYLVKILCAFLKKVCPSLSKLKPSHQESADFWLSRSKFSWNQIWNPPKLMINLFGHVAAGPKFLANINILVIIWANNVLSTINITLSLHGFS